MGGIPAYESLVPVWANTVVDVAAFYYHVLNLTLLHRLQELRELRQALLLEVLVDEVASSEEAHSCQDLVLIIANPCLYPLQHCHN